MYIDTQKVIVVQSQQYQPSCQSTLRLNTHQPSSQLTIISDSHQSSFLQAIIIIIAYVHLSVTETHQPKKIITISHHAHQPSSPLSSISESHHVYQPTFLSAIIPISHHICQLSCPCSSAIMAISHYAHHANQPSFLSAIIPIGHHTNLHSGLSASMPTRMFHRTTICREDNYTGKNFVPPIKTRSPVKQSN